MLNLFILISLYFQEIASDQDENQITSVSDEDISKDETIDTATTVTQVLFYFIGLSYNSSFQMKRIIFNHLYSNRERVRMILMWQKRMYHKIIPSTVYTADKSMQMMVILSLFKFLLFIYFISCDCSLFIFII